MCAHTLAHRRRPPGTLLLLLMLLLLALPALPVLPVLPLLLPVSEAVAVASASARRGCGLPSALPSVPGGRLR